MRLEQNISVKLSENFVGGSEYGDHNWIELDEGINSGYSKKVRLDANQVDVEFNLGAILGNHASVMVYLRTDENIKIKLNSVDASVIPVVKIMDRRFGYFVLTSNVERLFITNENKDTEITLLLASKL
jgi:hypothetical protein